MFDEIQLNFEFGAVRKILCSSHSHSQRRVPFALFSFPSHRPRCPDDGSQKRFSLFSDWIQKAQKDVNLVGSRQELSNECFTRKIRLRFFMGLQPQPARGMSQLEQLHGGFSSPNISYFRRTRLSMYPNVENIFIFRFLLLVPLLLLLLLHPLLSAAPVEADKYV